MVWRLRDYDGRVVKATPRQVEEVPEELDPATDAGPTPEEAALVAPRYKVRVTRVSGGGGSADAELLPLTAGHGSR